jgi:hypothetical protein
VTDRARGYPVIGRDRHRRAGPEQLPDAAHVHDDVVTNLEAPFLGESQQTRSRLSRALGRVQHQENLAAFVQITAERLELRLKIVVLSRPSAAEIVL